MCLCNLWFKKLGLGLLGILCIKFVELFHCAYKMYFFIFIFLL